MKIPVSLQRCDSYDPQIVREALWKTLEPLGGMGAFISKGQRVLLKPNLLSAKPPEAAVTTHPEIIRAIAMEVLDAGARPYLGDSPAVGSLASILKKSGIGQVVDELGIEVVPFKTPKPFSLPEGGVYRSLDLAAEAMEYDAIINLPKFKTHGQLVLTLAVKNLFGTVVGAAKISWHLKAGNDLRMADLLLDINRVVIPVLNVLDGVVAMEGSETHQVSILGLSRDEAAVKEFVLPAGTTRVDFALPDFVSGPLKRSLTTYPVLDPEICTTCELCARVCPVSAIRLYENGGGDVDRDLCISCFCCQEMCPDGAIRPVPGRLLRLFKKVGIA